jgi:TPR repeat protein
MYFSGRVVEQDYVASIDWYREAAKQGSRKSMYRLGSIYENGYGTERDIHAAVYWYTLGAAEGELAAQLALADIYEHGRFWGCESTRVGDLSWCDSVSVNISQSEYWYRQASRQGSSRAQKKLLELAKGGGLEEDPLV